MSLLDDYMSRTNEWEKQRYHLHGPQLQPHPNFSPSADVAALEAAIKAKGVDEHGITKILVYRTNAQRQEIKSAYQKKTGRELCDDLKKACSGQYEEIVLGLLDTPAKYDAHQLYRAMKGLGTDEACLTEILVSRNNDQICALKKAFKEEYKCDLIDAIRSDTSGDYCKVLEALLKGERAEDVQVNDELVDADARALYEAGERIKGTKTSVFIEILIKRSFPHILRVMQNYKKFSKNDLSKAVDLEMKGDIERCLLDILKVAMGKADYFAEKFYLAMKGSGTKCKELNRLLLSNSEGNMKGIKAAYKRRYGRSLNVDLMAEKLGQDYEEIVLALCGPDN
ncbi:annexin A1-like [Protopterus annectens]|uniref:annexin A1-like n=1 Tax=Protopterus annectens TaxID=7888 RepID=UPI001CFC2173|nr:annexin A1-like [Protopterus annectens]XP_043916769.1 annexin A1-like [Protopterus annectens]